MSACQTMQLSSGLQVLLRFFSKRINYYIIEMENVIKQIVLDGESKMTYTMFRKRVYNITSV